MNKKVIWIVALIIVASAAFLLARSIYNKDEGSDMGKEPNSTISPINESSDQLPINIPEEYIKLVKSSADTASFEFEVPVVAGDVNGNNIYHCVVNVSARAESDDEQPECQNANSENKFSITYDANKQLVTIRATDLSEWGLNNGPFRIGCAACISAVKFTNIHAADGQALKDKLVSVY